MEPLLVIAIIVIVGLLLFAVEALVTPGFGIPGIAGALCFVVADGLVYHHYGTQAAILALFLSTLVVLLGLWWFSRSKTLERMSLQANIDSTNATTAQLSVRPGQRGRALTRLALIGNAEIEGKNVEVKSAGGFIDEGTPIEVCSVEDALILVRPIKE